MSKVSLVNLNWSWDRSCPPRLQASVTGRPRLELSCSNKIPSSSSQFHIYLEPGVDRYLIYWQGGWFQIDRELEDQGLIGEWMSHVNQLGYCLPFFVWQRFWKPSSGESLAAIKSLPEPFCNGKKRRERLRMTNIKCRKHTHTQVTFWCHGPKWPESDS